jgi:hypothetical protein
MLSDKLTVLLAFSRSNAAYGIRLLRLMGNILQRTRAMIPGMTVRMTTKNMVHKADGVKAARIMNIAVETLRATLTCTLG